MGSCQLSAASGGAVRSSERSVLTAAEKAVYSAGLTGEGVAADVRKDGGEARAGLFRPLAATRARALARTP